MDLLVRVKEIRGTCPVYKMGDFFTIRQGFRLEIPPGQPLCLHGLASLMPFYRALAGGISPEELGLSCASGSSACVQCPDVADVTGGGTVVFEISPETETAKGEVLAV